MHAQSGDCPARPVLGFDQGSEALYNIVSIRARGACTTGDSLALFLLVWSWACHVLRIRRCCGTILADTPSRFYDNLATVCECGQDNEDGEVKERAELGEGDKDKEEENGRHRGRRNPRR